MHRFMLRYECLLAAAILVVAVPAVGCRPLATTAAYLLKGTDVDPEFKGLEGKKVIVVCRPVASLSFGNPTVAADLARQVSAQLKANVSKIHVIDQQKVAQWLDAHDWSEYAEVGKALEADMVVGIELQDFALRQGQTLYQGRSSLSITVYACAHPSEPVFEKSLPRILYPPNTGVPASEMAESEFRRKFVGVLADRIARHFFAHDANADLTQDLDAL